MRQWSACQALGRRERVQIEFTIGKDNRRGLFETVEIDKYYLFRLTPGLTTTQATKYCGHTTAIRLLEGPIRVGFWWNVRANTRSALHND